MNKFLKLFIALLLFTACSSKAVLVEGLEYSLVDIQKAIVSSLPVGLAKTSENQREYSSQPYRASNNGQEYSISDLDKERSIAYVVLLGDRRPYSVKVKVTQQKKIGSSWQNAHENQSLAIRVSERITDYLSRNSQKNLIDHFRAF